jgi:predicted metal-dependent HD superfamily phosphohydrolase
VNITLRPRSAVVASTFAVVVLALWFSRLLPTNAADNSAPNASSELAKLQQEQIASLREASKMADEMLTHGIGSVSDADRLNHMLVDAELDAATSAEGRIQTLQGAIAAAKKEEGIVSQQVELGVATVMASLEAKSYRLGLEIRLSKESAK